jgi:hypothetical protein
MTDDQRMAYGRLAGDVARCIVVAARKHGIDPVSFDVPLDGAENLTLRQIAEMIGGMGYVMDVELRPIRVTVP